jgi:hypothetical protein
MSQSISESHTSQIEVSADQSESFVFDLASQWQVDILDFWKLEGGVTRRFNEASRCHRGLFCDFSLKEVVRESSEKFSPSCS